MTSLEQLIHDFRTTFDGDPWFGDSYSAIVGDIAPEEALAAPPNGHSICVLLWHMVKWRKALSERLLGNLAYRANVTDDDNWPPASDQTASTWEAARAAFAEQQAIIVRELSNRDEAFLDSEFLSGRTFRLLAMGVAQHDIYHLGQIAMLKGLVRASAI
jgi:uncharacterized damage-inducible protein DinB